MSIDANHELSGIERAHLSVLVTTDGFKIMQKLMEDEVKKFNLLLINASNTDDIIAKHNLAKAAAQFYQGVIDRVNQEVLVYHKAPKSTDKPLDMTSGLLDLGDMADTLADVPNIMEME